MKNILRVIIFISFCIAIFGMGHFYELFAIGHRYSIGLVYVPSRAFHEHVGLAIKELFAHHTCFNIIEFIAPSTTDQLTLSSVCDRALDSKLDAVICVGQASAQTLVKLSQKRQLLVPILFLGVNDPVRLGIVDSIERPGNNATGIYHEVAAESISPMRLLHLIKPQCKNVLLPYSINERTNETSILALIKEAQRYGIHLTPVVIDNVGTALERILGTLHGYDTLLYLEGDAIGSHGAGMGKIASQHNITMVASSPDGIHNAAFFYSADPRHYAQYMLSLLQRILIMKESPSSIKVELVNGNRSLIINKQLCSEQDLKDIDINGILNAINTKPEFEVVRGHVVVR